MQLPFMDYALPQLNLKLVLGSSLTTALLIWLRMSWLTVHMSSHWSTQLNSGIYMDVYIHIYMYRYITCMYIYRGLYYKMSGQMELETFLHNPEQYVAPAAPKSLPPPDLLPMHRSQTEIKAMFPKRFEIQGFCPVTYIDGKKRFTFTTYVYPIAKGYLYPPLPYNIICTLLQSKH